MNDFSRLSDDQLLKKCEYAGRQSLQYRYEFQGYLPEVDRRKIYRKKGFGSIFEFAAKLGGLTHDQVVQAIRVDRKLHDFPHLHALFTNGEVGVNKLERAAMIANPENQEGLARQIKHFSKNAIETLVRDFKNQNGRLRRPKSGLPGQGLNLDPDVENELSELQQKGIDINAELREFLKIRKEEIARGKEEAALELEHNHDVALLSGKSVGGRYIPATVKRIVEKEYGKKCAVPQCLHEAEQIHHTARFALTRSHDPHYLAPLCKAHHEIAHQVDVRVMENRFS